MTANLFKPEWIALDSDDLRVLFENRVGGPGQTSGLPGDNRFYLPLAGKSCRLALRFKGNRISAVERGESFDHEEWSAIGASIDALTRNCAEKVGRNIAFSGFRVTGWWRGEKSGVQILPPPVDAPTVPTEMGEHPFVLEFPLHEDEAWHVTNLRRLREHRKLVLILNVLLSARINCEPRQHEHMWVCTGIHEGKAHCGWFQRSYFADFGQVVANSLSVPSGERIEALSPEVYFARVGHDGSALRVPNDLDESICRYRSLAPRYRQRFDRALFWLDAASQQWPACMSSSFASLVSAIECLVDRGSVHRVYCEECGEVRDHDAPGPTALFRDFFETYAPGASERGRRSEMYALRSGILHGNELLAYDEGRSWGWDPPGADQDTLHRELWSITRLALRNYLINPTAAEASRAPPK